VSQYYEEDLDANAGRAALDFSWGLGATGPDAQPDDDLDNGIQVFVGKLRNKNSVSYIMLKATHYANSQKDRPLQTWVALTDEYVEMDLRREGRGSPKVYAQCAGVNCIDPKQQCPNRACAGVAEYRCGEGVCVGEVMRCAKCMVAAHAQHPTHFIEGVVEIGASGD
jgi:hypothetical protein